MSREFLFVEVGPRGRVVIPAVVRKRLGIAQGVRLALEIEDGAVVLLPPEAIDARLHAMFADVPVSLADELIAERRADAKRENEG